MENRRKNKKKREGSTQIHIISLRSCKDITLPFHLGRRPTAPQSQLVSTGSEGKDHLPNQRLKVPIALQTRTFICTDVGRVTCDEISSSAACGFFFLPSQPSDAYNRKSPPSLPTEDQDSHTAIPSYPFVFCRHLLLLPFPIR